MATMNQQQKMTAIQQVLTKTITKKGVEWSQIMSAINAAEIPVKNWLTEVRGVMQALANQKKIARTPDAHKEVWVKK